MVAVADRLKGRSFTRVADWSAEELTEVLDLADELKSQSHGHACASRVRLVRVDLDMSDLGKRERGARE